MIAVKLWLHPGMLSPQDRNKLQPICLGSFLQVPESSFARAPVTQPVNKPVNKPVNTSALQGSNTLPGIGVHRQSVQLHDLINSPQRHGFHGRGTRSLASRPVYQSVGQSFCGDAVDSR